MNRARGAALVLAAALAALGCGGGGAPGGSGAPGTGGGPGTDAGSVRRDGPAVVPVVAGASDAASLDIAVADVVAVDAGAR